MADERGHGWMVGLQKNGKDVRTVADVYAAMSALGLAREDAQEPEDVDGETGCWTVSIPPSVEEELERHGEYGHTAQDANGTTWSVYIDAGDVYNPE